MSKFGFFFDGCMYDVTIGKSNEGQTYTITRTGYEVTTKLTAYGHKATSLVNHLIMLHALMYDKSNMVALSVIGIKTKRQKALREHIMDMIKTLKL